MVRQLDSVQLIGNSEKPCSDGGLKRTIVDDVRGGKSSFRKLDKVPARIRQLGKDAVMDSFRQITANEVMLRWLYYGHEGRWPWWIEVTKWE